MNDFSEENRHGARSVYNITLMSYIRIIAYVYISTPGDLSAANKDLVKSHIKYNRYNIKTHMTTVN